MSALPANFTPGLPPNGATGDFIGRDAHGNTFLLHWHSHAGWEAMGWEGAGDAAWPIKHNLAGQQQGLIVGHLEIDARSAPAAEMTEEKARQLSRYIGRRINNGPTSHEWQNPTEQHLRAIVMLTAALATPEAREGGQ